MKIHLHRLSLPITDPFTIARGTITDQQSLVVELRDGDLYGLGEVTVDDYYGHTFESMTRSLAAAEPILGAYRDDSPETVWPRMIEAVGGDRFAMAGLDIAAHDLWGKRKGKPCWEAWGLLWGDVPVSSYTIGIDTVPRMIEKLDRQPGWQIYKIKLGTPDDIAIVRALREHTDARFRVDANCGWTAEQTIHRSQELRELGVEFIEQPLPAEASPDAMRMVYERSALPVIADESCRIQSDVAGCHGLFHGVNVKLCKCGGLTPALAMLRRARELGMKTMIGCMVETSVGISAAAHLLPLLDFADLDGAILLKHDPATGVRIRLGEVAMPTTAGLSARLNLVE
jgi:L-alanine-DL-glutamate epimerase-like enolase superfamily enzyme